MDNARGSSLGWSQIFNWSVGTVGPVTMLYLVSSGYLIYMTDVVGMSAGLAGALIFGVRLYDMCIDPLVGRWSDQTRSRMGRRRPWMLAGAIVSAVGCALLFAVPRVEGSITASNAALVALGALMVYFTGYSLFNVPYLAMPAEMTDGPHDRTRIMFVRVVFVSVSSALGAALAPRLIRHFGGGATAYQVTALFIAGIGLAAMLWCVSGTRGARATTSTAVTLPLREQLSSLLENRPFVVLLLTKLLLLLSMSSLTASLWYMVQHVLHHDLNVAGDISLAQTAGMLAGLPLWLALDRRYSKRLLFVIACLGAAGVLLSWLPVDPQTSVAALLVRGFGLGAFNGGALLLGQSMLPDTMEYDFVRTGLRREGAYSGLYSVVEKGSFAFGPFVVGQMLAAAGYVAVAPGSGPISMSAEATQAVYLGLAVIPAVATALCAGLMKFYHLDAAMLAPPAAAN